MSEENKEVKKQNNESTINFSVKKDALWKYSTFILAGILIIGAVIFFNNGSTTGATVNTGDVDLSEFLNNPDLYPSIGPANAKNVVIEFSDFQCPYCALASGIPSWTAQYQTQYGDLIGVAQKVENLAAQGELRFIYVSMSFLGQESVHAAQAGLCANEQGKFWEMHDAIFRASTGPSENDGKYSKTNLKTLAQGISGLDQNEFADCLDNDKTLSDVQTVASQASKVASGTPTFYINGQKVPASWTEISSALGI